MHSTFIVYIGLVLAILFLVMLAQKLKISYPIILVLAGLVISFIPAIPAVEIDPDLIFVIFLPPLLYEAAWGTSWKELWRWRRVIGSFAFFIVILTASVVAYVSYWLIPGFTLALGFLLGGIVSPPDAVSASSILKSVKVPRRAVSIIEGESLLNDAASLVIFRFAVVAVSTGSFVFKKAALDFVLVIVMGILIGLAIAYIFYAIHRWLPTTTQINIVLSFVAPYVMYIVAEQFHFSGVLAVVSGGLFLSIRDHEFLDHRSRLQGWNVWRTIGFVLNGLIFMLIGLELPVVVHGLGSIKLSTAIGYSLLISVLLIVLRILCTLGASVFTRFANNFITTADPNPGWRGPIILGWTGMRGVVSLAAALSVPVYLENGDQFPQRNLILFITFSVILVTLVVQGLTLPAVIRWVKMEDPDAATSSVEADTKVRKKMTYAALRLLEDSHGDKVSGNQLLQTLQKRLSAETDLLVATLSPENNSAAMEHLLSDYKKVYLALLDEQRTVLYGLNKKSEVDEAIIRKYLTLLDIEQEKLFVQYSKAVE
jgi:Na+/H+ antiporter